MAKNKTETNPPPTLCTDEPGGKGRRLEIAFGYMNNEPCAALFVGDSKDPILLPRDFLKIAVDQGWVTP